MSATIPTLTRDAARDLISRAKTMHPFDARTVRTGRWCYRIHLRGKLEYCTPLYERIRDLRAVLYATDDNLLVANRRATESLCRILESRGVEVFEVEVGKATIGSRGFYDDGGFAFEAAAGSRMA